MDEHKTYKLAAQYRLELILLGFALSAAGDRAKVFDALDREAVSSASVAAVLGAIEDKDGGQVRALMESFGISLKENETVLESLMRKLSEMLNQRRLKETLAGMIASGAIDDFGAVEDQLGKAMETMKRIKGGPAKCL